MATLAGPLIGVDLGGTKLAIATFDGAALSESTLLPTSSESSRALIEELAGAIKTAGGREAAAVGIGIPSVVDFATGTARASVNIPLRDVPLQSVLEERLGVPVYVDNDATVAALAEACDGGGEIVVQNLVMFTVGTGVGGGLVLGGRVYRGATGAAGEVGHTLIGASLAEGAPPRGSFPQRGSLEALAAGHVLDRMAAAEVSEHPDSALGRLAAGGELPDGHAAVEAAKAGDEAAIDDLRILGERLGIGVANAINTFDPDEVVIGGGVSVAGDLLLEPARRVGRSFTLPGVGERTEIRLARWGPQAGVRGAALLAAHKLRAPGSA